MPSFREAFPSRFLKADDLGATCPVVKIATVDYEQVAAGQDPKLVAHFEGEAIKPLALNLTNCTTVADITGTDDYQAWPGHVIQLFVTSTAFQGKRVQCIRIRRPQQAVPTTRPTSRPRVVDPDSEVGY